MKPMRTLITLFLLAATTAGIHAAKSVDPLARQERKQEGIP